MQFYGPDNVTRTINAHVASATENRVHDLIPPKFVQSNTFMVMANGASFDGLLYTGFDKPRTMYQKFHGSHGEEMVEMMATRGRFHVGSLQNRFDCLTVI